MTTSTADYTVRGMTCNHCVASVSEEVGEIPGVTSVEVDLESGRLTVSSDREIAPDAVRTAVEESGYELAQG
ncbi:MAG TPA: heavy metal-associated domain-containing protein [Nocardioidaceae bacterium]|nr:heavy metal-associated domain-containing protein [Nocardioidaceae bacterium]